MPPAHVTVAEAAARLDVPPDTIRGWAKKGLLRSYGGTGADRTFDPAELERLQRKLAGKASRPYKVLRTSKKSPFTALELFTGCGGLALGVENAGISSRLLVELDRDACTTLIQNWGAQKNKTIVNADVADLDFSPHRDKIDIVAGGFPCQAFSYAGHGRGFGDTRGTLFFEFARCVDQVRPKIALGENVRGLLRHDGGRTLHTMVASLQQLGYRTAVQLVRAQFLDVPQKRERLLLLAVRDDLDLPFLFPAEQPDTLSLRQALKDVPDSPGQLYPDKKRAVLDLVPEGGNWRDLPDDVQRDYMGGSYHLGGGKTGMARRLAWDEPSLTLTCSPAQKQTERCHPGETRPLTTREYARVQTFPDSWKFAGGTASVYRQVGNAVPVNLAYHVGRCLVAMLDPKRKRDAMVEGTAYTPPGGTQLELGVT